MASSLAALVTLFDALVAESKTVGVELSKLSTALRTAAERVLLCSLPPPVWQVACWSLSDRGLGLIDTQLVHLPAFMASALTFTSSGAPALGCLRALSVDLREAVRQFASSVHFLCQPSGLDKTCSATEKNRKPKNRKKPRL